MIELLLQFSALNQHMTNQQVDYKSTGLLSAILGSLNMDLFSLPVCINYWQVFIQAVDNQ